MTNPKFDRYAARTYVAPPQTWARAEAAILEAKDDLKGALDKLDQVEAAILALQNTAQREIALRALRKWKSELWTQRNRNTLHTTL